MRIKVKMNSSQQHFELSEAAFYEPIQNAVSLVQAHFHAYQTAKFPSRPPEFFSLELCGEAGELANLEKKKWKGKTISNDALADEAADVLIALMNYANARSINLAEAVILKLQRIEERRQVSEECGEGSVHNS
jgi:NTP pyrophosphatase (non-canonical NTP hydrolase)